MQKTLFETESQPIRVDLPDSDIRYYPHYLSPADSQALLNELLDSLTFQTQSLQIYGKHHLTPRLVAWCADPNVSYTYSGDTLAQQHWSTGLFRLKHALEQDLNTPFNGALLNYYRDGEDHMGWHSDDEASLGETPIIASLSLGAERTFQLKHKHKPLPRHDIHLQDGSLLIMAGQTQQHWQHCLPKRKRIMMARMNITFRSILTTN